jgi:nucleoside-diphosphate-sugar epimerase
LKKVLVIGGSGFLGRHVIQELCRSNFEVYALEHKTPFRITDQVKIVKGSIGAVDRKLIRGIRPDLVFHLARPTFPRLKRTGRHLAARYAAMLNQRLIRELEKSGHPCRLIFASGSLMYGNSSVLQDEDSPLNPISYARQYYRGEMPVLKAMQKGILPVTVIRFPWLLGRGSWFEWFYLRTMKNSGFVPLFGNGDNRMEIIDILDAAKLAVKFAGEPGNPSIVNLISARPVSQLDFASAVSMVSGKPVRDYLSVIPGRIEREALEAFSSNIIFETKHKEWPGDFPYTPLTVTISRILDEYGRLHPFENE